MTPEQNITTILEMDGASPTDIEHALDYWNERAAVREFDGNMTRNNAEQLAILDTLTEWNMEK